MQLATDLITLLPKTEYGKLLISQTTDLINKRSESGKLGGRPPKSKGFDLVSQDKSEPKPKPKPETEPEKEKEKEITTTTTDDFILMAQTLLSVWSPAAAAVDAVAAALVAGNSIEFIKAQIEYSRANAKANPSGYLQAALKGDYAGFNASAQIKAAATAKKQAKQAAEDARQAEEDAALPTLTGDQFFLNVNQLEGFNAKQ
ncbi:hypothetical protein SAMN02745119_01183 [Trichlorobacter thiogenes]|uniref:Uncharacterized protein n=1 Tax=Trichlorobacter thiogenes TaxID=115783 RepID=A0A1T4M6A5_9BACT|nr:hypothetical protein SAMN02745119_01183 [Trichlorobacter thiogenes]